MTNERKKRVLTISILISSILVITIGFAAFSAILRITSSATVTPNASDFKVVFSSSENALETNKVKASPENMGEDASIDNITEPTITGLSAKFTNPGDSVSYIFYVRNEGQYKAFLNSISFRGKKCTPQDGANFEMVNNACNSITTTVTVGNIQTSETKTNITGETLEISESKQVTVTIKYDENGARADGPFTVEFGDISMHYATVNEVNEKVEQVCQLTNDVNGNKQVDLGDEVTCGGESFYVLPNDSTAHPTATGDNITLLTKYNLNVGTDTAPGTLGIQNQGTTGAFYEVEGKIDYSTCNFTKQQYDDYMEENGGWSNENDIKFYKLGYGCNGTMPFSETQYWETTSQNIFVYNDQSLLYPHVENYKTYVKNLGVDVKEASLISFEQLIQCVDLMYDQGLYLNMDFTGFWVGSTAINGDTEGLLFGVQTNDVYGLHKYSNGIELGIRPIIVIPISDIEIS